MLRKSGLIIDQVIGLLMGDNLTTPSLEAMGHYYYYYFYFPFRLY